MARFICILDTLEGHKLQRGSHDKGDSQDQRKVGRGQSDRGSKGTSLQSTAGTVSRRRLYEICSPGRIHHSRTLRTLILHGSFDDSVVSVEGP